MSDRIAFDEGYDAYWEGVDVDGNPYDETTNAPQREAWRAGWRLARKHDYDESEA
jgi:ribosome modulation factor